MIAAVLVCLFVSLSHPAVAIDEAAIRCKVCDRAIAYVWEQGVQLRQHCKRDGSDARCHLTNLHRHGIDEMVRGVCDDLPKTHQSLMHSEFDLIAEKDPQHEPEIIDAIRSSCLEWVHGVNTIKSLSSVIYANLDAGKSTRTILHRLQEKFCERACEHLDPPDEL